MPRPSVFTNVILLVGLCAFTAGCAGGFGSHQRDTAAVPGGPAGIAKASGSMGVAKASGTNFYNTAPVVETTKDSDSIVRNLSSSPTPRETRLSISETPATVAANDPEPSQVQYAGALLAASDDAPLPQETTFGTPPRGQANTAPMPPSATSELPPPVPQPAAPVVEAAEPQAKPSQPDEVEPTSQATPIKESQATEIVVPPTPTTPAKVVEAQETVVAPPPQTIQEPQPRGPATLLPKEPEVQQNRLKPANATKNGVAEAEPAKDNINSLVTLRVDDQDVKKVLEMISRQTNAVLTVSPGVSGNVTLHIKDRPLDETLRIIAEAAQLRIRRKGDVIYVSTLADIRKGEADELPMRIYHLCYVNSGDVMPMIKPFLTPSIGQVTQSPDSLMGLPSDIQEMSDKGSGGSSKEVKDAGGNSMAGGEIIIVQDYESVLKKIDQVIREIDIQPIQVLIEAVIIQVSLDKGMELGVNFAMLDKAGTAMGVVGNGALLNASGGFNPASLVTTTGKIAGSTSSGLAENIGGVKFGWVGGDTTGFIRALERVGETKVLASPRILVLNKQRAEIHMGKNLGYYTSSVSQTSTTQDVKYLKIGTQLRLRPFVTSEGIIRMEIHPERSTGALDTQGIPQTTSAQVTTNIMIPEGNTVMIGGLIDDETTKDWTGVPFLSRIPFLGYLFRNTIDGVKKRELVVLITPHIYRPSAPESLNYLGAPSTRNLEKRVGPQQPFLQPPSERSLYEVIAPPCN